MSEYLQIKLEDAADLANLKVQLAELEANEKDFWTKHKTSFKLTNEYNERAAKRFVQSQKLVYAALGR